MSCPASSALHCSAFYITAMQPTQRPIQASRPFRNALVKNYADQVRASFRMISENGGAPPLQLTDTLHSDVGNPLSSYHTWTVIQQWSFVFLLHEN